MVIDELILSGFKRFSLLGTDNIHYKPNTEIQLFTGKNGIGKSSLINELSPLPCDSSDLKEDGFKIVKIEHRGSKYVVEYSMDKKFHCSFKKDGKELNDGGTIKVQRSLIWEHFKYDDKIHDVLIGFDLFSNMSPQTRREWFMRMSKSDMNYAISLYNRLRSAERDIKGAIKLNNQRLVSEQAKLPSSDDIQRAKNKAEVIKNRLNYLLPLTEHGLKDYGFEVIKLGERINHLNEVIVDFKLNVVYNGVNKTSAIQHLKQKYSYEIEHATKDYKKCLEQLNELHEIIEKNKQVSTTPLEEIDRNIYSTKEQLNVVHSKITNAAIKIGTMPEEELELLPYIESSLVDILSNMKRNPLIENEGRLFSTKKIQEARNKVSTLNDSLMKLINKIKFNELDLKSLEEVHDTTCPSCNHIFKPGVDLCRVEKLKEELKEFNTQKKSLEEEYSKESSYLEEAEQWLNSLRSIRNLQDNNPVLNSLFVYLQQQDVINDNPTTLLTFVKRYKSILEITLESISLQNNLKRLEEDRVKRIAAEGNDIEYVMKTIVTLEEQLKTIKTNVDNLHEEISKINNVLENREEFEKLVKELKQSQEEYNSKRLETLRFNNNQKLQEVISSNQSELASSEKFVAQLTQSETIIKQLQDSNKQLQNEQKTLSTLVTLLSPQDGLIAESMMGFLNQFLDEMSNVLDQIWSYSMRPYIDLGEDGLELDYRFKVEIEGLSDSVKDVSRLSKGQKEVVDFVFKLLLMQHLDLNDCPIFMDEVGGSFDAYHRDRLYRYIKLLVESNQASQVFVISHIASSHDALSNYDKIVLDTDATLTDDEVNKVIEFN